MLIVCLLVLALSGRPFFFLESLFPYQLSVSSFPHISQWKRERRCIIAVGLRTGSGQQVRSLQPLVLCPSALATSFTNVWEFGAWFCLCPYIYSSLWVCLGGVSATECSPQLNAGPPSPCIFSFCLSLQCFHCWSLISQSCWNYVSCRHFFFWHRMGGCASHLHRNGIPWLDAGLFHCYFSSV